MNYNQICIIFLIIYALALLIYFIYKIKKDGLRTTVINLILQAEKHFGSGNGKEKMQFVIGNVINILPAPIKIFITTENVEKFIQTIFDEIKEVLEYESK